MIVIQPKRLIVGDGTPPRGGVAVVVEGGTITRIATRAELGTLPPQAQIIDAPDATLMPGMIDAHVHLAYDGSPRPIDYKVAALSHSYAAMALHAVRHARDTLRAGITAVRDLNAPGNVVIDLRNAINAGHVEGPRVIACGQGLTVTGGHMDKGGWGDQLSFRDLNAPCDGPEAFRQGVREQVKRGADCIKINLCGGSLRDTKAPYKQEMTDEEVIAAIDEAHRLEKRVAAHTSGGPSVNMAVAAGLDSVEHGHWIDEACADLMAERGSFYVPTLLVNERNYEIGREALGGSDAGWAWLDRAREDKWGSLERVRKAGVKVVMGTDAGFMLPHGSMTARELEMLVQGGLTPLEAITAATANAAELLDIDAGVLRAGAIADLLLVPGDPSVDIRALQNLSELRVWRAGREVVA